MEALFVLHQSALRLTIFLGGFLLLGFFELKKPRRALSASKSFRWFSNIGLTLTSTLAVRVFALLTPISAALWAEKNNWGLFHQVELVQPFEIIASLLLLDLLIYGQHVTFHKIPLFWRFHRVHHTDLNLDVSTSIRFHPFEILLSLALKVAMILLLGASALSVLFFEIVLNATAMFNHSNLNLPQKWDGLLRKFLVTPDMHRVHHSVLPDETDSNFGFNLPWWDYLFRTYRPQPKAGHTQMTLGLSEFREEHTLNLSWLLWLPFKKHSSPAVLPSEN